MLKRLLFLGIASAALSTAHAASEPKWAPVSPDLLAEAKPRLEAEAPAEIISYKLEINDKDSSTRDITETTRYKIYDPSRSTEVTRIGRFWNGGTNPYYRVAARLTLPDGSTRTFGMKDLKSRSVAQIGKANGLLGLLASDNWEYAERFLAIRGVEKGAVLDVWETQPGIPRTLWQNHSIQRADIPIRRFSYVSRYSLDNDVVHNVFVLHPSGGKLADDKKSGTVTFEAEDLPSIAQESYAAPETYYSLSIIEAYEPLTRSLDTDTLRVPTPKPVSSSLGPWAIFSTQEDFYDAAKGYPTRRVKEKAAELTAGIAGEREKAQRIYAYVQSLYQRFHIRADLENEYTTYIKSLDDVMDLDLIDSTLFQREDFYYLFLSLARSAGFECHSVFHPDRTNFPFTVGMVSERFLEERTVALKIAGNYVLCDPCSDVPLAFGALRWQVENQPALMAAPYQQVFLNVPSPPARQSRDEVRADLQLDASGDLKGDCSTTFTGHRAYSIRATMTGDGPEEWNHLARQFLGLENAPCEVRLVSVEGLSDPEEPIRVRTTIEWPTYASIAGNQILVPVAVFAVSNPPLLNESDRSTPVFVHYPSSRHEAITVRLPAGYVPKTVPKPLAAKSGDFGYALSISTDAAASTLSVDRETTNNAVEIPVADYPRARDWFRRVTVADQLAVILEPADNSKTKTP